jgi:hypothetical protein
MTSRRACWQPSTSHLDLLRIECQVEDEDERRGQRRRRVRWWRRHILNRGVAGKQLRGQHLLVDAGVVRREGVAAMAVTQEATMRRCMSNSRHCPLAAMAVEQASQHEPSSLVARSMWMRSCLVQLHWQSRWTAPGLPPPSGWAGM